MRYLLTYCAYLSIVFQLTSTVSAADTKRATANRTARNAVVGPRQLREGRDILWAAQLLEGRLGLTPPVQWSDILEGVMASYGKPLYFVQELDAKGSVSGLWIDTDEFGAVICRGTHPACTQSHVILHELAHVLIDLDEESAQNHTEEDVESFAFGLAHLLYTDRPSDEEAYFG
jgi:hypothetical protein